MRIIAGKFKSRNLKTLKSNETRPSSDRLKEGLFNKIGPYFTEELFLDVFSGSGAIGLEAISRGAKHVTLVEKERAAQKIIVENIKNLGVAQEARLIKTSAEVAVDKIEESRFDYIFMDPPYHYPELENLVERYFPKLKENGMIIVETDKQDVLPNIIGKLTKTDEKLYGIAKLTYYEMLK